MGTQRPIVRRFLPLEKTAVMAAEFFLDSGELFAALRRSETRQRCQGRGKAR